jgi:GxxExxY protein
LGPGFIESIYSKAFTLELRNQNLVVEREKLVRITYGGRIVGRHLLDMVVEGRIILELKATRSIVPLFEAQMRSYLSATEYPVGMVINFGSCEVDWKELSRNAS